MTLLFEAAPEPALPLWQQHSDDIDKTPADPYDYLRFLNLDICPRCCEDIGSPECSCDWARMAGVEQAGTPEISIDMRSST